MKHARWTAGTASMTLLLAGCGGGSALLADAYQACEEAFTTDDDDSDAEDADTEKASVLGAGLGAKYYMAELHDDGRTVTVEGRGQDDPTDEMIGSMLTSQCLLGELEAPQSLRSRMESTRALDGRQSYESEGIGYEWSYHPNSGMSVIIEDISDE